MAYINLPGTFPDFIDGNLTTTRSDNLPRVLILGTAGSGLNDFLWRVESPSDAVVEFGRSGSLVRGMYEALSQNAKSVHLMRIGGTTASLAGVGDNAGGGYTITPAWRDDGAGDRYKIFYTESTDRLVIFDGSTTPATVVWDNSPTNLVDVSAVKVTGAQGTSPVDIGSAAAPVAMSVYVVPVQGEVYVAGTDGVDPCSMRLYEYLYNAYELLDFQRFDVVVAMDAYVDELNTIDGDTMTVSTNVYPVAGGVHDVLGEVFIQKYLGTNYFWWDTNISGAAELFPSIGSADASTDIGGTAIADFHEVNFAHQLGIFCFNATENFQACVGCVGVRPPATLGLSDVATWVGEMPEYTTDPISGESTIAASGDNGTGLSGVKFLAGENGFRSSVANGGFIVTDDGHVDGIEQTDINGHVVDLGKYLSVVAAWVVQSNGWDTTGRGYFGSLSANYGGFITTLPSASAPTNKPMQRVRMPYRVSASVLDNLAGLRYIMLVNKAAGLVVADAPTAARPDSDYRRLTTVRIVQETIQRVRLAADPFLGEPMSTSQIAALNTALEGVLNAMKAEGKLNDSRFSLRISPQDAVSGTARVDLILVPAFELRRLLVSTSLAAILT